MVGRQEALKWDVDIRSTLVVGGTPPVEPVHSWTVWATSKAVAPLPRPRDCGPTNGRLALDSTDTCHWNSSMAKLKSELELVCPGCHAVLVVDTNLGRIVAHKEPERGDKPELAEAGRILAAEAERREALFEKSV